ncbi:MAG: hypothetical protein GX596_14440, partial [Propionibacterium sp.]|nr:hypothetical protein [Propionibacterium sp.]
GGLTRAEATTVDIPGTGETVSIEIMMGQAYTITGVVIGNGRTVGGASVLVYSDTSKYAPDHSTVTRVDGTFSVEVPPGAYRILVKPTDSALAPVWHDSSSTRAGAEVVYDGSNIVAQLPSA